MVSMGSTQESAAFCQHVYPCSPAHSAYEPFAFFLRDRYWYARTEAATLVDTPMRLRASSRYSILCRADFPFSNSFPIFRRYSSTPACTAA